MAKKLTKAQINDINLQYLPRLTVKNADEYLQKSAERSARVRKKLACRIDVPYGDTPGQMLDIFPAARKGAPVHVFIHGGYWRALDKDIYSHLAGPMVAAGAPSPGRRDSRSRLLSCPSGSPDAPYGGDVEPRTRPWHLPPSSPATPRPQPADRSGQR